MTDTLMPVHDTPTESRVAYLRRVAMAYDVPMNLIRYERIDYRSSANGHTNGGATTFASGRVARTEGDGSSNAD